MRRFLGQDEISVDDRMLLTYEFITVHWIHGSNRILRQDADMVTRARFNLDFSDLIRRLDVHGEATFVPFQRDIKRDRLFLSTAAQIKMQYRFPQGIALPRPFILWDTTNYGLPLQLMQHAAAHFPGQALLSEGRAGHDSIIMGLHAVWNANNQQAQDEMIQWNDGRFFVVWWTVEFWQSVLVQLGYSF